MSNEGPSPRRIFVTVLPTEMPDIFISYSRKDSQHALVLAERLRDAGIEIWIDQQGIEAAKSWSKEIVRAIDDCKAFLVLISAHSQESPNVSREVGIASEARKPMLPVLLEDIKLSDELRYHLSGIQRVAYTEFDAIFAALKGYGISAKEAAGKRSSVGMAPTTVKNDTRKALIILPFEDLSPTQDNQWFADGLAGELIDALGHIKSLRILDRKTSLELRGVRQTTTEIGRLFNTRYFIEGTVRKFGDQIKISCSLLDIETGDHLWQASHRGEFRDIFDIQESVANKVVDGLKLHLTNEERSLLEQRGTGNSEAYALYVRAEEYAGRQTREGLELALRLLTEAIGLDPVYAEAYRAKGQTFATLYRNYNPDPQLLQEGMESVREALRLKPNLWRAYQPLSIIHNLQGDLAAAERAANEFVRNAPEDTLSHHTLGYFYWSTGQSAKAIPPFEQSIRLNPGDLNGLYNLTNVCRLADLPEKSAYWASEAIPHFERYLKLHPDDEQRRVLHGILLHFAGRDEEARQAARSLLNLRDGAALHTAAILQVDLGEYGLALRTIRKAVASGYRHLEALRSLLNAEAEGFATNTTAGDYEEVKALIDRHEREQAMEPRETESTHA